MPRMLITPRVRKAVIRRMKAKPFNPIHLDMVVKKFASDIDAKTASHIADAIMAKQREKGKIAFTNPVWVWLG